MMDSIYMMNQINMYMIKLILFNNLIKKNYIRGILIEIYIIYFSINTLHPHI
jgi:hypothetical protein